MKLIKFFAVASALILFESFFIVGFQLAQPKQTVKTIYLTEPLEEPAQVTKVLKCPFNESGKEITVFGVGVHDDNKTGELIDINLELKPGKGRIFFDTTTHSFGNVIENSMPLIKYYAEKETNTSLDNMDLYVSLDSLSHEVDGSSASATMAVALIALIEGKQVNNSIVMTGSLEKTGAIVRIEGLPIKIKVAEQKGEKEILIPESQCNEIPENVSINVECVGDMKEAEQKMIY